MSGMTKTIAIEELKLGMYIERLDRSWLTTPFLRHRFVLRDEEDIRLLKQYGIKHVVIDPTKGRDVEKEVPVPDVTSEKTTGPQSPLPIPIDVPSDPQPSSPIHPPSSIPSHEEVAIASLVHSESVTAIQR